MSLLMKIAPVPVDEPERLRKLHEYAIVGTPPETDFDDIARLASHICDTPMASVTFIASKRAWLKARIGIEIPETSRDLSFCAHTIVEPEMLVVPDARLDARFADNPFVTPDDGVRFYAGAPLRAGSMSAVGSLCVVDRKPRTLTEQQRVALVILARQVTLQLELRRHSLVLEGALRDMEHTLTDKREVDTKAQQREAMLLHSAKIASLGDIAAGVAHEINNPLAIIFGKANQLAQLIKTDRLTAEVALGHAEKISTTALRISHITESLRKFARDDSTSPLQRRDLRSIVGDAAGLLTARFAARGIAFNVSCSEDPCWLWCRPIQIQQAIVALMLNAFEAVQDKEGAEIKLTLSQAGESCILAIEDSGRGIPPALRERLFQPFFSTKPVGEGMGLGLCTAHGAVVSHQGRLFLDDSSSRTRFVMEFPLASSEVVT